MNISEQSTISDIINTNYRTAKVFSHYNINFFDHGNKSIGDVSKEADLKPETLLMSLANVDSQDFITNYQDWPLEFLVDYIYQVYHKSVEEKFPIIKKKLNEVAHKYGSKNPEIHEIEKLFNEGIQELSIHMKKEEHILFPYVKMLAEAKNNNQPIKNPSFITVENPIFLMQEDHNHEGKRYDKITKLSNSYKVPEGVDNSYKELYKMLEKFDKDLKTHLHLESNVLFKKAIEIEKELIQKN